MPTIKIVASSDLHSHLPDIPECDLLLLAGDLCPDGSELKQALWLDTAFRRWLRDVPAKEIVGVAGNHDFVFQNRPDLVPALPWHYLQDSGIELFGLHIWGTPWQPVFYDWAFNLDEEQLKQKWQMIPKGTDILLLHGPPQGFGDRNSHDEHTGSPSLTKRIQELQPQLALCGHIHEARGEYRIGQTLVANVSQLNLQYQPHDDVWEYSLSSR
ncbi:MAG: metallophosphoesterase [Gemmatales bacterium]